MPKAVSLFLIRDGTQFAAECPLLAQRGHQLVHCICLLLTQSGHSPLQANKLTRYDSVEAREAAMRRRDFISGVLGSAAVWPLPALAQQQPGRARLIGSLTGIADDSELKVRYAAFRQELQHWVGSTAKMCGLTCVLEKEMPPASQAGSGTGRAFAGRYRNFRRSGGGASASSDPDHTDRFATVADPVGSGLVESLAEPGGNATGLAQLKYSRTPIRRNCSRKLRLIVAKRVAVIWDPTQLLYLAIAVIQSVAAGYWN